MQLTQVTVGLVTALNIVIFISGHYANWLLRLTGTISNRLVRNLTRVAIFFLGMAILGIGITLVAVLFTRQ